jgi:hypothetical protein
MIFSGKNLLVNQPVYFAATRTACLAAMSHCEPDFIHTCKIPRRSGDSLPEGSVCVVFNMWRDTATLLVVNTAEFAASNIFQTSCVSAVCANAVKVTIDKTPAKISLPYSC